MTALDVFFTVLMLANVATWAFVGYRYGLEKGRRHGQRELFEDFQKRMPEDYTPVGVVRVLFCTEPPERLFSPHERR